MKKKILCFVIGIIIFLLRMNIQSETNINFSDFKSIKLRLNNDTEIKEYPILVYMKVIHLKDPITGEKIQGIGFDYDAEKEILSLVYNYKEEPKLYQISNMSINSVKFQKIKTSKNEPDTFIELIYKPQLVIDFEKITETNVFSDEKNYQRYKASFSSSGSFDLKITSPIRDRMNGTYTYDKINKKLTLNFARNGKIIDYGFLKETTEGIKFFRFGKDDTKPYYIELIYKN